MTKIVIKGIDSKSRVVTSKPYDLELVLQENIKSLPELIPIEDAIGDPVGLLTIGMEVSAGSGAIDLLLLSSDGVVTIVETKLARNPESRREVVGQVLEYAAFVSEWGLEDIRRIANRFLDGRFDAELKDFLGADAEDTSTVNEYLNGLDENLKAGRLRLIVATDRLLETVRKTITFVNRNSNFEIYMLQVTCYEEEDGTRIYVPALHGYAQKANPSRSLPTWEPDERAESLVSRLEVLARAEGWKPERLPYDVGIEVTCLDVTGIIGIEFKKRTGLNMYFFSLDHPLLTDLPETIKHKYTKEYLYLWGDLEHLSDEQLRQLCEAAVREAEIEPSS
jgi:hypothetical protein